MKTIVLSTFTSIIERSDESKMLKTGYLLGDSVCAAGVAGAIVDFKRRSADFDLSRQLTFLENTTKQEANEEGLDYVLSVKHSIKEFKKIKHPTREVLVANQKIIRDFTLYFEECVKNFITAFEGRGFKELMNLSDQKVVTSLHFATRNPTLVEPQTNVAATEAENILNLLFPVQATNEPSIMIFPVEFVDNDFLKKPLEEESNESYNDPIRAIADDELVIVHCLSLPVLDGLNEEALKAIRSRSREDGREFREKMDVLIRLNKENKTSIKERKNFLVSDVLPAGQRLEAKLGSDSLIIANNVKLPIDAIYMDIYIGEAPIGHLWEYYTHFYIFEEDTIQLVKDELAKRSNLSEYIPFICMAAHFKNTEAVEKMMAEDKGEEEEVEDTEPKLRKFISVDD